MMPRAHSLSVLPFNSVCNKSALMKIIVITKIKCDLIRVLFLFTNNVFIH